MSRASDFSWGDVFTDQQAAAAVLHRATPCYTPESKAQPIIPSTPPHTSLSSSLLLSVKTGLETQSLPHCWIEDSNPRWETIFNPKPWFCFSIQKANIMFTIYCLLCGDDKSFEDDSSARPWYSMEIVPIADSDDVLNASLSFPHIYVLNCPGQQNWVAKKCYRTRFWFPGCAKLYFEKS